MTVKTPRIPNVPGKAISAATPSSASVRGTTVRASSHAPASKAACEASVTTAAACSAPMSRIRAATGRLNSVYRSCEP